MNRKDLFEDLFGDKEKNEVDKYRPENKKFKKTNLPKIYNKAQSQKKLKKEFDKLRYKALYLNMEYEDLVEKFKEIKQEFIERMLEYCRQKKIKDPFESVPPNHKQEQPLSNKEVNRLFTEIVKKTHPDKNNNIPEKELEKKVDLYNQAVEGKRSGNFRKVLKVALELNLKIKEMSPELINQLKKEISLLHENIKTIRQDIMFKWYHSNKKIKQDIFELLTKNQKQL